MEISVVCAQFCPVHKNPLESQRIATGLLSTLTSCDILVLPEMAFTGYSFANKQDIEPLLEQPNSDFPTFNWCVEQATKFHCYVFCGYPEADESNSYNSMMVLTPTGVLLANHRKKHLYYVDKTWSSEGASFTMTQLHLANRSFTTGLALCMDINPYEFLDNSQFELASHWAANEVDFCIFSTNWTAAGPDDAPSELLDYWVHRLSLLLRAPKPCYLIVADRTGSECGISYMGTSCVVKLCERPEVLGLLPKHSAELLTCTLTLPNNSI